MAENSEFVLHYITNSLLSAATANSVAKIEMARSFCKHDRIKKVFLYMLVENKEKLQALNLADISDKLIVKPLFFRRNVEQALHGKDFWRARYKTFFVNPTCYLRAFLLALKLPKTDAVFIRGHESLTGFYFGCLLTNIKYAFELHNYTFGKNRFTDFLYRRIMKRARFIVTVSECTKQGWVDNAIAEEKIIVLPSGVNLEDFDSINKAPAQLRSQLNLPTDKKIITYSGGLYENKRIEEPVVEPEPPVEQSSEPVKPLYESPPELPKIEEPVTEKPEEDVPGFKEEQEEQSIPEGSSQEIPEQSETKEMNGQEVNEVIDEMHGEKDVEDIDIQEAPEEEKLENEEKDSSKLDIF